MATIESEPSYHKKGEKISQKKEIIIEDEAKDIYFIISYTKKEKEKPEEVDFSESDIIPENILTNELKQENGEYFYKKVFKFNGKTNDNYSLEFEIDKDNYIITFEVKENSFVYDVELKKATKLLKNIAKEIIDQKIVGFHEKLYIFLEALKKNNKEDLIETLYRETIDLFGNKKDFSILISLFVQIYKNKELCPLLMEKFKDINIS